MKITSTCMERLRPFFEEPAGGEGGAAPAAEPASNDNKDGEGPQSFADFLKANPSYQSELDRRINQAVETATTKERERQQLIKDQMQDEVLRVSKMTQQEKDAYFKAKAEKEAADREASLTRRELTLDARAMLQDKHLPESFIDLLDYTSKDACMKSVEVLDTAFQKAVQEAVNEKLKGSPAPKDARTEGSGTPTPETAQEKALKEAQRIAGIKIK